MRYLWRLAAPQANTFVRAPLAGASRHVSGSSLPVRPKVPTEVRIKRKSDAAKEALGWERGQLAGSGTEGHDAKVYVSTR